MEYLREKALKHDEIEKDLEEMRLLVRTYQLQMQESTARGN